MEENGLTGEQEDVETNRSMTSGGQMEYDR